MKHAIIKYPALAYLLLACFLGAIVFYVMQEKSTETAVKENGYILFGLSADYPPFEYYKGSQLVGFDVELARLVASHLGKQAVFQNMQFSHLLPALMSDRIDAAISTIHVTPARQVKIDFSTIYYRAQLAIVYQKNQGVLNHPSQLFGQKVAVQLGTVMHTWSKTHIKEAQITLMDSSVQLIEALKSKQVDAVILDRLQATVFQEKNPTLTYSLAPLSDQSGYAIAFKKASPLTAKVKAALDRLKKNGDLERLEQQWIQGNAWKH